MTRLLTVCLFMLALAGCAGGSSTSTDPYTRGADAVEKYQFVEADSIFTSLMSTDSTSARAFYLAGFSKERQLMLWDAMEFYLQAITRDERYAPAFGGLARVFSNLGSEVMAADAARKYAELSGTDIEAWTTFANLLIDARQFPEAQRALTQAETGGLPAEASSLIKARIAWLRHDYPAAEAAASATSGSIAVKRALADYLETSGQLDSAMAVSRAIMKQEDAHQARVEHFFRALRTGYLWDARQVIADMAKRDKSEILPRAARVLYFEAAQEWPHAMNAAHLLQEIQPVAISTFAYLYQVASRSANVPIAGSAGDELMVNIQMRRLHPVLNQYAIYRRIAPRVRLMAPPHAIISLDSVRVTPIRNEIEFQAWYAFALEALKNSGDTLPTFQQFIDEWQNDPAHRTAFAATRMGYNPIKAATAETLLVAVLNDDPHFRPAFDSLVVAYSFASEFGKAAALYEKYSHFLERYPLEAIEYAVVLAESDRGDDAMAAADRGLAQVKGNTGALDRLARVLNRRGFASQARSVIEKALALEKGNPDLLAIASRVAGDNGDFQRALAFAEQGLDLESNHSVLLAEKGRALFDSGKQQEGLQVLEDAASREIGNADGLLYLSRRLASINQDAARAQDLARQAMLASPLYQRASINLAYVYLLTGKANQARGAAQTALKIYPNDAEAFYLLGKALYEEKDPEAKPALQKALQFGLKGDPLKDAQALLQRI